jgi:uncharacterized protein YbjT (DUF2867 family)
MRVAIAGGHGKVALHLSRLLEERDSDEIVSLIRNPDHAEEVRSAGGEPVEVDLEQASADEIAAAIGAADAIVFAAGAGPGSGVERKESVDYGAAVKLIDVGRQLGIERYVMLSSIGADAEHEGDEVFDVYLRAKGRADRALIESGLTYVIVRPGMLTDDPGMGRVEIGESVKRGEVSREDVAAVLAVSLRAEHAAGHVFEVVAGDTPVAEAVGSI